MISMGLLLLILGPIIATSERQPSFLNNTDKEMVSSDKNISSGLMNAAYHHDCVVALFNMDQRHNINNCFVVKSLEPGRVEEILRMLSETVKTSEVTMMKMIEMIDQCDQFKKKQSNHKGRNDPTKGVSSNEFSKLVDMMQRVRKRPKETSMTYAEAYLAGSKGLFTNYLESTIAGIRDKMKSRNNGSNDTEDSGTEEYLKSYEYGIDYMYGSLPGTKWCGIGDVPKDYRDLGSEEDIDICCRMLVLCPVELPPSEIRYNIPNRGIRSMYHCACDKALFHCLKNVDRPLAKYMGTIYFNLVQYPCLDDVPRGDQEFGLSTKNISSTGLVWI